MPRVWRGIVLIVSTSLIQQPGLVGYNEVDHVAPLGFAVQVIRDGGPPPDQQRPGKVVCGFRFLQC